MTTQLKTKPGINGANVLSIPQTWDPTWFRHFIHNSLKGADVRNAVGTGGITVTGNISSPYATINGSGVISSSSIVGTANEITVSVTAGVATIRLSPNVVIPAPASGNTLTVTGSPSGAAGDFVGSAGNYAVDISGSGASGQSYGLFIAAGTTSVDAAIRIVNEAATANYFEIFGDGHGFLTPPSGGLSWSIAGNFTIATPAASTTALNVMGAGTAGFSAAVFQAGAIAGARGVTILAGTSSSDFNLVCANTANTGNNLLTLDGVGNLTINAASGTLITVLTALTNGSGALVGTLSNSPATGNPTKWIPIVDNGVTRHIPAW